MRHTIRDKRFDRVRIFRVLFLFYCLTLLLLAILPINGVSSPLNHTFIVKIRLDYLFHSLVFIPWMLLISFAFTNGNRNKFTTPHSSDHKVPFLNLIFNQTIGCYYC